VLARLSSPDLDQEVAHLRNTLAQTQTRREMVEGLLDRTDMLETGVVPASFTPVVANSADQGTKNYAQARHALFLARQRVTAARVTQLDDTIATLMTAEDIAEERVASQAEKLQRLDKLLKAGHVSEFRVSEARDRLGELRGEAAAAAVVASERNSKSVVAEGKLAVTPLSTSSSTAESGRGANAARLLLPPLALVLLLPVLVLLVLLALLLLLVLVLLVLELIYY
jgi:hypothetical protein